MIDVAMMIIVMLANGENRFGRRKDIAGRSHNAWLSQAALLYNAASSIERAPDATRWLGVACSSSYLANIALDIAIAIADSTLIGDSQRSTDPPSMSPVASDIYQVICERYNIDAIGIIRVSQHHEDNRSISSHG